MNTKTLIAAVAGAIVSFLMGWVVWGMLLMKYYESNYIHYDGLMLEMPKLWAIFAAQLANGILFAWLFSKMNITNFGAGFINGMIITFLVVLGFDLYMYSNMNLFANNTIIIVDVVVNTLFGGVVGGIIALILGKVQVKSGNS